MYAYPATLMRTLNMTESEYSQVDSDFATDIEEDEERSAIASGAMLEAATKREEKEKSSKKKHNLYKDPLEKKSARPPTARKAVEKFDNLVRFSYLPAVRNSFSASCTVSFMFCVLLHILIFAHSPC